MAKRSRPPDEASEVKSEIELIELDELVSCARLIEKHLETIARVLNEVWGEPARMAKALQEQRMRGQPTPPTPAAPYYPGQRIPGRPW